MTTEKSTGDLARLCRTCNTECSHMRSLFTRDTNDGLGLHDMLLSCTNLKILKANGLSNSIEQRFKTFDRYKELGLKSNSDCTETTLVCKEEPKSNFDESPVSDDEDFDYSSRTSEKPKHSKKRFKCDVCEKSYSSVSYLQEHKQTHNNILKRRFKCDVCDKSYSQITNLRRHKQTHNISKGKHFECNVCGKSFSQRCYLWTHKRIHKNSGRKRFECDVCGKLFSQNRYLIKHKRSHEGNERKRYECDVCDKWYFHSHNLKTHKRTHDKPSGRSMKNHRAFEEGLTVVTSLEAETFVVKTEIETEELKCSASPEDFVNSQQLIKYRRDSFEEGPTIVTSLEKETLGIKTEIKQEDDRFF